MSTATESSAPLAPGNAGPTARGSRAGTALAVWLSFFAFSAVRTPVPAINEPHYLGKAKHFWNPQWCAGDFFLEAADVHLVFYAAIGWLTRLLTLEQTAWAARAAALLLLAWGWTRLIERVAPGRWTALWAAWIYLFLSAISDWSKGWAIGAGESAVSLRIFDLSGEWIIGGVEGKVFAYGLLFWGLALAAERRWHAAAICAGVSVSFHPVVGIWGLAAAAFAGIVWKMGGRHSPDDHQIPRRVYVTAPALLVLCSLPGVIPALQAMGGVPERTAFAADFIQVYYRLQHHLDPKTFPITAYVSYGVLLILWLLLRRQSARAPFERAFALFVAGALLIAVAGLAIGLAAPPRSEMWDYRLGMRLMKFYPFRLADVLLPIAVSIALAGWVQRWASRDGSPGPHRSALAAWLPLGAIMISALALPAYDANPSRMSPGQLADWKNACRWINANAPRDALFFTPLQSWAFKWYAQRPEYVAFKDCPQDPAGIVEWNRRLTYLRQWGQHHWSGGYTPEELRALHEETGITHIIARRLGPFAIDPVYRSGSYRVFDLRPVLAAP